MNHFGASVEFAFVKGVERRLSNRALLPTNSSKSSQNIQNIPHALHAWMTTMPRSECGELGPAWAPERTRSKKARMDVDSVERKASYTLHFHFTLPQKNPRRAVARSLPWPSSLSLSADQRRTRKNPREYPRYPPRTLSDLSTSIHLCTYAGGPSMPHSTVISHLTSISDTSL